MNGLTDSSTPDQQQQRVVLLVEYVGTDFAGSQQQANALTVQEAMQQALDKLNVCPASAVTFSGRTDAGVHAKGQVAHVDVGLHSLEQIPDLNAALNAVLPETIAVKDHVIIRDFRFHSIVSAQWRWYQYRIFNHPVRSAWMPPDAAWVKPLLDLEAMQQAAHLLLGEHDFESFKCPQTAVTQNICQVIHSQLSQDGDTIVFDIVANRFVYKMVRNLVGTLVKIGEHSGIIPEDIPVILNRKSRQSAGPGAQPRGLSLMAVHYPEPWDFFQNNVYVTRLNQVLQESSTYEKDILRKAS